MVVIGILIALGINNWNEVKKTRILETKIFKELHSNLVLDIQELHADITYMGSINKAYANIKTYLETFNVPNESFYKTLSILRVTPHFDPNKSGYELLRSKGVEVISNDSLRNSISLLYERTYPYYRRYEEERLRFHVLHSEPILLNYFYMNFAPTPKYYGEFIITIEDYKKLQKDNAFYKLLSAITFENMAVRDRGQKAEVAIKALIKFIQFELESKKQF